MNDPMGIGTAHAWLRRQAKAERARLAPWVWVVAILAWSRVVLTLAPEASHWYLLLTNQLQPILTPQGSSVTALQVMFWNLICLRPRLVVPDTALSLVAFAGSGWLVSQMLLAVDLPAEMRLPFGTRELNRQRLVFIHRIAYSFIAPLALLPAAIATLPNTIAWIILDLRMLHKLVIDWHPVIAAAAEIASCIVLAEVLCAAWVFDHHRVLGQGALISIVFATAFTCVGAEFGLVGRMAPEHAYRVAAGTYTAICALGAVVLLGLACRGSPSGASVK